MFIQTLKKRSSFVRIGKKGLNLKTSGFFLRVLEFSENSVLNCGVGYTVTKKVGNAVERNRIKRRLRAVVKYAFPLYAHENYSYVLIGRRSALESNYQDLLNDLIRSLKKIHDL